MRKILFALFILVFLIGNVSAGVQDFYIYNETGFTIYYIFVSPTYSDEWEEDLLGDSGVLYDGEDFYVEFSGYDTCYFDILVEDEDGYELEIWDLSLCDLYSITLFLDNRGNLDYWVEGVGR